MNKFRKHISAPGLLKTVRNRFEKIPDHRINPEISQPDALMSGLAVFSLKYPSLLQFDQDREEIIIKNNLKNLFGVENTPCDTQMREILDPIDPDTIRPAFSEIFSQIQRSKELMPYRFINGDYLVSMDGTGHLSSKTIHCDQCLIKISRNGETTFYHQNITAAIVHPDQKQVIPLDIEPITRQDGNTKNDCERNASKRLIERMRKNHQNLKINVLEDALAANGPHIKLLRKSNMNYIIVVKPGDHKYLFDAVEEAERQGQVEKVIINEEDVIYEYHFVKGVPLNKEYSDILVNFIEYWETHYDKEKNRHYTWITEYDLLKDNIRILARGGQSRWKIENEVFNTLKNQGYHFEHNYGHGSKNLATVFSMLMILAFLLDQVQELSCQVFQEARKACISKVRFWKKMQATFMSFFLDDWYEMFTILIRGPPLVKLLANPEQDP